MKSWISKSILFVLTLLSLSCKEDDPAVKLYQGEVHYYDTDEPMAGVDLRVKFIILCQVY
ncbi:MAG TPA: hypothetical protein VGK39_05720 [Cyclobacteriaceae bacterium]